MSEKPLLEATTDMVDEVFKDVQAWMKERRKEIKGVPGPEFTAVTDQEIINHFALKTAEDPNWVLALPFVDGGPELIADYRRLRGLDETLTNSATLEE